MKLQGYLIIFFFIFNINNKAEALTGIGPIKFNNQTMDSFFAYLRGDGNPSGDVSKKQGEPLSFAVNPEGTTSFIKGCDTSKGKRCDCKRSIMQGLYSSLRNVFTQWYLV